MRTGRTDNSKKQQLPEDAMEPTTKNTLLKRTFKISLERNARYTVKSIAVAVGDQLTADSAVLDLEVTRTKGSGDNAVETVTIERKSFQINRYAQPKVEALLVSEGQALEGERHAIFEYSVEETFANLIEGAVRAFSKTPSNLYFAPEIPEKKAANALKKYAPSVDRDRILFLYDATLFGSATDGFLATDSAFYYHNGSQSFSFRFNTLESVTIEERQVVSGSKTSTQTVLAVHLNEGPALEISDVEGIRLTLFKDFLEQVIVLNEQGHTKDVDGYVIVEDMPAEVRLAYLKVLIWLTYQDDGQIDERELAELQVLMTQLAFDAPMRLEIRAAISEPEHLNAHALCEEITALVPSGSEMALRVSLLKDAVRVHRATADGSSALKNPFVQELAKLFDINEAQLEFIEQACIQDEKILSGEISDSQLMATAKDLSAKAASVGVPIAAVYLSGSVAGLSAAGVTSGLATLGLGGVLGFSSMVTGIGVAILLGVGIYKGLQWAMGGTARDKASRRELMLQEVLRIHQKSIANLAEDVAYFAEQLLGTTAKLEENELTINKLKRDLSVFVAAMKSLRSREEGFEQNLVTETEKRAA